MWRRRSACSTSCGWPRRVVPRPTTTPSCSECCWPCASGTGDGRSWPREPLKADPLPHWGRGSGEGENLPAQSLLRWRVVRVGAGRVVGGVQHFLDLRKLFLDEALDAGLQRDVRRAAALTAAAHLDVDLVVLDFHQLDEATMARHGRIDGRVDQLLHLGRKILAHVLTSLGGLVYTRRLRECELALTAGAGPPSIARDPTGRPSWTTPTTSTCCSTAVRTVSCSSPSIAPR